MAQNGRFSLSLRVLSVLAQQPDTNHTSAAIGEALDESPVMVRRVFLLLHEAGFVSQRKGPQGGAKLKMPAKSIGLGDLYAAVAGEWLSVGDKSLDAVLKKTRQQAIEAMNETTIASVAKKLKKS
ncbi:DNA-binding transcriptional regulator, IscR family [Granulicella rosea]|uniref:DNA-binding transcriptional regulator, IscR family n=1 Tax=Granulicella rosea TaxID=474952 RepID=A0A239HLG1_9BACT|nr:Rrf2 family transcriptional regulator [Granulicella rosea]SNS81928.1 DNA-binding transcriptional regulator, IscR family [Granulicella rosea]